MRIRAWIVALILLLAPTAAFALATLTAEPGSHSFAARCVRTAADARGVTLANEGNRPATDVRVRISPSSMASIFPLSGQTAVPSLAPSAGASFRVGFVPGKAGEHAARARIDYVTQDPPNDEHTPKPRHRSTSVALDGEGIDRFIDASPRAINFGDLRVGTAAGTRTVTVYDDGDSPLQITAVSIVGPDAGDFSVRPRGARTITESTPMRLTVGFTPGGVGARSARLRIASNACADPLVQVELAGVGVTQDVIALPGRIEFGSLEPGERRTRPLTVANQGGASLQVSAVRLAGSDARAFRLLGLPSMPETLGPGESFDLRVRFQAREDPELPKPDAVEPGQERAQVRRAQVVVRSSDGDSPSLAVALRGSVQRPQPTVSVTPTPTQEPTPTPTPTPTQTGPPLAGDLGAEAQVVGLVVGFFALLVMVRRVRGVPD